MRENVNSIDDRVKEIELQPAKRYNTIIEKVILKKLQKIYQNLIFQLAVK